MKLSKERRDILNKFSNYDKTILSSLSNLTVEELEQLGPKTRFRVLRRVYDGLVCRFDLPKTNDFYLLTAFTKYFIWKGGDESDFCGIGVLNYQKVSNLLFPLVIKGNDEVQRWLEAYKKACLNIKICARHFNLAIEKMDIGKIRCRRNTMIWTTKDGQKIPINELPLDHLRNIISHLEKEHEKRLEAERGSSWVVDSLDGPEFELEDEQRFPQLKGLRAELRSRMEDK